MHFVLVMVVDFVVPEQALVAVLKREGPRANVLVRVLDAIFKGREMFPVFPMRFPLHPTQDSRANEGGNTNVDRDLQPQGRCFPCMLPNLAPLADEVVLWPGLNPDLLGGFACYLGAREA